MADILYMQDEDGENSDEALDNTCDSDVGAENRDDFLPPLIRLQKYCNSENMFHRQMVARLVLETLRAVADEPSDVASVIAVFNKLADDPEGSVRAELMEQVPHIAMLCHEDKGRLHSLVLDHLLPLIVKFLGDKDNQVRKTSQAALLVLMEQGLIEQSDVEEKVCPVILMLTEMDSLTEFHTGAVALMSKMAPLIGRNSTERLFLGQFAALCTDEILYVRKVCAANFGEFCAVVGTDATENILLPRFVDLCEDEVWGVRKACAETFMSVSCACTLQTRKQRLAPVFANLLVDQSRWVRMSAFQTLGPFISTFADPSITGLSYNQDGELVILSPEGFEFRLTVGQMSDGDYARIGTDMQLKNVYRMEPDLSKTGDSLNPSEEQNDNQLESYEASNWEVNESNDMAELEMNESHDAVELEIRDTGEPDTNKTSEMTLTVTETLELNETETNKVDESINNKTSEIECEWNENENDMSELQDLNNRTAETSSSDVEVNEEVEEEGGGVNECVLGDTKQQLRVSESQGLVHIHLENSSLNSVESYNTFQYWRVPIPELELDISLADSGKPTSVHVKAKVTDEARQRIYASELNVDMEIDTELEKLYSDMKDCLVQEKTDKKPIHAQISTSSVAIMTDTNRTGIENKTVLTSTTEKSIMWLRNGEVKTSVPVKTFTYTGEAGEQWESQQSDPVQSAPQISQDIVPQQLIDHFVSMTHPSQAHKTDNDIAHHCAYSLPAVALTLGRENWTLLKEAYTALASDMQWKVRRTVASSIHELAVILGEDLATKDLVPIFNGFIKDLDEVRIGALKHLAEFLKLLRPMERNSYLPRLSEFLLTDNEWNWRFREELAEQLLEAVNLFTPDDTKKYLTPIAITLLLDKVAAVRLVALSLVTELVKHVSSDPYLLRSLLAELAEWFAHSKRWNRRQTFALLCSHLVVKHILSEEMFAKDVLPHLLDLSWDPVPNVRLSVARTLSSNIMTQEFFSTEGNPHHEVLLQVLKRLQTDADRDVRYFASLCPSTNIEEESSASPAGHT